MVIRKCDVCKTEVNEFDTSGRAYFPDPYTNAEVCADCNHRLHDIKTELDAEIKELYREKLDRALDKILARTPKQRVKSNLKVSGLTNETLR